MSRELLESFKKTKFGTSLDEQEFAMLFKHNKMVAFNSGETILQQGKIVNGIYLIIEGRVILTAKILVEGVTTLEVLGEGSFLGEISFIEKIPSSSSVVADTPVKCLFINNVYLELLSAYFPKTKYKIFYAISAQVCERLKKMHDKIIAEIANSDMATQSFFTEIIHSMAKPECISFHDARIEPYQLQTLISFEAFSESEKEELFKHGKLLKAEKNCILIHKAEHSASCYIVLHGAVQSSIVHENKIAKLSIIGPSILFASISCIDKNSDFTITFTARESAVLLKFDEKDLDYFQKKHPELWFKVFDLICRSLVALEKSIDKLDVRLSIETYNR